MGYGGPHAAYIVGPRRAAPAAAGPAGRRLPGRRRQAGLPARAAGPRAAHPPGKGDQQHLHRAGAAGRDGRDVRGVPRPRRAGRDRRRRAPARGPAGRHAAGRAAWMRPRADSSTRSGCACPAVRRRPWTGPARPATTCSWPTPTRSASPATRPPPTPSCWSWPRCWPPGRGPRSRASLAESGPVLPAGLARSSEFLSHPVFHEHRSETAMLRYLRRLADFDIALDRSMIPLGSCTMKLNAAAEMEAVTWPEFADLHPFAPRRAGRRVRRADQRPGTVAGRDHRVRRGVRAAERRVAG